LPCCNHLSQQQAQPPKSHQIMVSTRSSTRIRQSTSPERPSSTKKDDFPPSLPKEERGIRSDVKKPLEQVRLTSFIHVFICVLLVFLAWYSYRATLVTMDAFKLSTGAYSFPSTASLSPYTDPIWKFVSRQVIWGVRGHSRHSGADVERRVEELAETLGVGPLDFASAIADAVRQFVPPASLSLLASEAKRAGGGPIMDALLGEYGHDVHIADGVTGAMG